MNNKSSNNLKGLRWIVLAYLFLGCFFVSKAQDEIRVSPLSSKQFEHCEGDQFYINFWRWNGILDHWDNFVFSALQHNNPVKSIELTVFRERMIYDEPTMVEEKNMSKKIDYTGDYFVTEGKRVWKTDGLSWWFPSENSLIFETRNQSTIGTTNYIRDEHNRVKRVDRGNNSRGFTRIIDYTYWSNTDYIYTIKCYDRNGKMIAEVKYDYLTTSKKTLLKEATCKFYEITPAYSYAKETYIYRLNYNTTLDVNQVDLFYEEDKGYEKQIDSKSINVIIERDKNGNIKTCICKLIKYEKKTIKENGNLKSYVDEISKGYHKNVSWQFTYDNNNNWITMTKTQNRNGDNDKYQIKRELIYDTPKVAVPPTKSNQKPSQNNYGNNNGNNSSNKNVVIDGSQLRLRLGPSTSYDTFKWPDGTNRHPNVGDRFKYLGESGDFYKIDFNGNEVWVSKQYSHLE